MIGLLILAALIRPGVLFTNGQTLARWCGLKLGHAVLLRTTGPAKDTERAYTLEDFFAEWKVVVGS